MFRRLLFLIPAFILLVPYQVISSDYQQVAGLIDLRTTFSDGEMDLESLVELAKRRGFSVLIINDHDRLAMEYGLFPFRNILRKRVELNAINKRSAEEYLNDIKNVQRRHPDIIIIPGSESAPFYYWTGSYFDKNLTAHNHERRILTIGLQQPDDYKGLPILHNGFSAKYLRSALPSILPFIVAIIIGFILLKGEGIYRGLGIVICSLSVLFIIDSNPFRSSPFDQYHGDQGIAPHQMLIDYVDSRGGLTFWNYPETRSGTRKIGPIFLDTPPYPEVLQQSKNYTGFSVLYGDRITATEPGNIWDRVLMEHCKGERDRPVWGISTADFHKEGGAGEKLGNFPTVFLVRKKTKEDILNAMREGRIYACRGKYPQRIILNDFSICSSGRETGGISGNGVVLKENPRIHLSLSLKKTTENQVEVRLIRSGELIKSFQGSLPMEIDYEDNYFKLGQKIYYRIDVKGCGAIVSNPIFVTFG